MIRTAIIVSKPECFGQLYDPLDQECIRCELNTKCIVKGIHNVDKEIKKMGF